MIRYSAEMKKGYEAELAARRQPLENTKLALETWYARKLEEANIVGEEKDYYDKLMNDMDNAIRDYNAKTAAIRKGPVTEP